MASIREITSAEAKTNKDRGIHAVYLDVREPKEWNLGHLPGAVHIPLGFVAERAAGLVPRDAAVIIYCATGNRSKVACDALQRLGWADVVSMAGGIRDWLAAGGEIEG